MQSEIKDIEQWVIAVQASIDTAKYLLGAIVVLCGVLGSLIIYIFKSYKEYAAERFKKNEGHCESCAQRNTEEHKTLHGRIDKHIDDHLNNK